MKKKFQILLMLAICLNLSAQNIIVNPNLKIDSTQVKITQSNYDYYAFSSFDNGNVDSLIVTISSRGTSTTAFKIDFALDKPKTFVVLYSDVPEYDGSHVLNVEFEFLDLEINSTEFKIGERIMGQIKAKSKVIKSNSGGYQIDFDGEFNHIIGKLMLKRKAEETYQIFDNRIINGG